MPSFLSVRTRTRIKTGSPPRRILIAILFITSGLSLFISICFAADKSGVTPNTISLPSGPGSVEGLGESFQPALNTGTAKYRVALSVPRGTAGHNPDLSLTYDGGGSNGPLGFGWSLGIPFVQRQCDKGIPRYVDGDNDIDDDGDGLVDEPDELDVFINELKEELVLTSEGFYFCENEEAFIRYCRVGDHWEGAKPDGTLMEFGLTPSGRIEEATTGHVHCWMLEKETDTNGNTILYTYGSFSDTANINQRYLLKVQYGPGAPPWENFHFALFAYEDRPDWFEDCRSGFTVRTGKRVKEIIVGSQGPTLAGHASSDFDADGRTDYLNRRYVLAYEAHPHWSLLTSVTWVGADDSSTYPPLKLGYTIANPPDTLSAEGKIIGAAAPPLQVMDNDLVDLVDSNGDGLPDILKTDQFGGSHAVSLNLGETADGGTKAIRWSSPIAVGGDPLAWNINLAATSGSVAHLADMDGDGLADLCYKSVIGDVYYFDNQGNNTWGSRLVMNVDPFESAPPSPFGVDNVKTADLDFDKRMDIIQSIDTGGSADYRIWFNLGDQRFSRSITVGQDVGFMLFDTGVHIVDFNGDRLPDVLRVRPTGLQVTAGLGYGKFAPMVFVPLPDYTLDVEQAGQVERARLQDITGDGLVDLVIERAIPGEVWYWINLGTYTLDKRRIITGMPTGVGTNPEIRWADLNGNGTTDLIYADSHADPRIQTVDIGELVGCVPSPNMIVSIDNGIGRKIAIEYSTSTRFLAEDAAKGRTWPNPLPFPVNVVSKVTVDDSMGNQYVTEYTYHDGCYDGEEKEFRGFAGVEVREIGDETAPDLISAYQFDAGVVEKALKGKTLQVEARNAQNQIFYREQNTWETRKLAESSNGDGREVTFPFQRYKTRDVIEKGNGTPVQLKWEYEYDNYGNATRQVEHGRTDEGWDDERVTETSYTAMYPDGLNKWILRSVVDQKITDENETLSAHKRIYYDNNLNLGQVSQGNLTRMEDWVTGSKYVVSIRNDYDAYGNILAVYDPLYGSQAGHYRELVYDGLFHAYPVREIIHTGKTNPPALTFSAGYDYCFGILISATGFNGFTTYYGYDAFGRLTSITKPPETANTIEYHYALARPLGDGRVINWIETRERDGIPPDNFLHSRMFYDGLGRLIMTRAEGEEPGVVVVSDTIQFNARKQPWKQYLPYFDTGTLDFEEPTFKSHVTEYQYDAFSRETLRINPPDADNVMSTVATAYLPLKRTVSDENNNRKTFVYDGLERLLEVQEANQGGIYIAQYLYNTLGNLLQITDAQDNIKTMRYDGLGRRTMLNDPDRGCREYDYDDAGNLTQRVDNKSQTIVYTYDGTNRQLTEDYLDDALITPDVVFHYDTPSSDFPHAENTKGKLAWVEDLSGASFYSYDERGNAEWSVKRLTDVAFSQDFMFLAEFDAMDRVVSQIFPDGDRVTYEYNSRSLLESIPKVVDSISYLPSGQISVYAYANGLATTYTYDPRNRLTSLRTDTTVPSGDPIQDLTYSFDGVSNVMAITDRRALPADSPLNATQSFGYDDLYRLTRAEGPAYGIINYQYDKIGNMIFKSSPAPPDPGHVDDPLVNLGTMTSGGTGGTSGRGLKLPGDAPGPHAITSTGSGMVFDYDDNGNMVDHAGDIYEWDFKDRLVKTTTADTVAEFVYDHSGQRVIKKSESNGEHKVVYYVSKAFEIRDGKSVKYLFDGNRRVARIEGRLGQGGEETLQILNFRSGWNFVSLTVEPGDPSINVVLGPLAGKYTDVWAFNSATQTYVGYVPGEGITDLSELHPGIGYAVKLNQFATLMITGTRTGNDISLKTGWNLVSCPSDNTIPTEGLIAACVGQCKAVWEYDTENGVWKTYLSDYPLFLNNLNTMKPGKAYWVKMTEAAHLDYQQQQTKIYFYHPDHLGSSSLVTDSSGNVAERTEYYPYGRPRYDARADSSSAYKYTGMELDQDTGLMYHGARYYEAVLGRFLSADPLITELDNLIEKGAGLLGDVYAYGGNNPINFTDPTGLFKRRTDAAGRLYFVVEKNDSGVPGQEDWMSKLARDLTGTAKDWDKLFEPTEATLRRAGAASAEEFDWDSIEPGDKFYLKGTREFGSSGLQGAGPTPSTSKPRSKKLPKAVTEREEVPVEGCTGPGCPTIIRPKNPPPVPGCAGALGKAKCAAPGLAGPLASGVDALMGKLGKKADPRDYEGAPNPEGTTIFKGPAFPIPDISELVE